MEILLLLLCVLVYIIYKNNKLIKNLNKEKDRIKIEADTILKVKDEINEILYKKEEENEKLKNDINNYNIIRQELIIKNVDQKKEIEILRDKVIEKIENQLYERVEIINEIYSFDTSEEFKNELEKVKMEYKELIKNRKAVNLNNNKKDNENKIDEKKIIGNFDSDIALLVIKLNVSNIDKIRQSIIKKYESLNKLYENDGLRISPELLDLKLKEMILINKYNVKKMNEIEIQKEIKAKILEEEKVKREIEEEKLKIEKEIKQFKNESDKLCKYLGKTSDEVEKEMYIEKIKELEFKLNLLEKDKENVLEREQNTRAGFVYIISNIGSFGEDIYKIGLTRRLEPMDRINELSSASVPFTFDVHAMIFTEDAPSLENALHKRFNDRRVNKVNNRKEFFKVKLSEIEDEVKVNYNGTAKFNYVADAKEYYESLKIIE